jgi:catechol 2,3-dioxygenase-like lactoylglutathione lyase family enzyme
VIDRFHHLFIAPADYEASLAFYRDTLGWAVTESWGGNGEERGTILSGGGVKVVIAEKSRAERPARPVMHLDIHDVDKRFASLGPGVTVVRKPEATHWGTRWFVVRDPDGNEIAFEEDHNHGG